MTAGFLGRGEKPLTVGAGSGGLVTEYLYSGYTFRSGVLLIKDGERSAIGILKVCQLLEAS